MSVSLKDSESTKWSKVIDLKDFAKFATLKKDKSPLDLFWEEILAAVNVSPSQFNVSNAWVHPSDYAILKNLTTKWAKKNHKSLVGKRLETSVGMLFLDIGPAIFNDYDVLKYQVVTGKVFIRS